MPPESWIAASRVPRGRTLISAMSLRGHLGAGQRLSQTLFGQPAIAERPPVDDNTGGEEHAMLHGELVSTLGREIDLLDHKGVILRDSRKHLFGVNAERAVELREQGDSRELRHDDRRPAARSASSCLGATYMVN